MARRRIIISSAGGIAAGSPFVAGGGLFVQQATPPVAFTQRFAILEPIDSFESIVAPGINAGGHSFVMGEDAEDSTVGTNAVLVGYALRQNRTPGVAANQTMFGHTIQLPIAAPNCSEVVYVGSNFTFNGFAGTANSFGNNTAIGPNITLQAINAGGGDAASLVAIGASVTAFGFNTIIGVAASGSDLSAVAIGSGATAGLQSQAIGNNAIATATKSISIGQRARAGVGNTIIIGWFADGANSDSSIAIGTQANTNGKNGNIMLGRNASVALDNFMQIGGDLTYPINEIRFGAGFTQSTGGQTYTFGITTVFDGAGNNLSGNGLVVRAGNGTGNWANGAGLGIDFQCGLVQANGSTQQPNTSVLALRHSDLNISLWGGMGATFGGGKLCVFVKNATTAPTVAPVGGGLLYAAAGALHWLGSGGTDTLIAVA